MKLLILSLICFLSIQSLAKVKLNSDMGKPAKKRILSQVSYLDLAEKQFEGFLLCAKNIDYKKPVIESPAAECIQRYFYESLPTQAKLNYLIWMQQNIQVSPLHECEGDNLDLAKRLRDQEKDQIFCFSVKDNNADEKSMGLIVFRIRGEEFLIYKIK